MALPLAATAADFWASAQAVRWAVADTDVLDDDELLELASGLGPVVAGSVATDGSGSGMYVTDVFTTGVGPTTGTPFHRELAPTGEPVAWVVFHCVGVAADGVSGAETALAPADAVLAALSPDDRAAATQVTGTLHRFGRSDGWRLLDEDAIGRAGLALPGVPWRSATAEVSGEQAVLVVPDAEHRSLLDHVESTCHDVATTVAWAPGRVVVFDNHAVLHARLPLRAGARSLRRVLVGRSHETP